MKISKIDKKQYIDYLKDKKIYSQYNHYNYSLIDSEGNCHYEIVNNGEVVGVFRGFKRKLFNFSINKIINNYEFIIKRSIYFIDLENQVVEFTKALKQFMNEEQIMLFSLSPAIIEEENNLNIPFSTSLKTNLLNEGWNFKRPTDFNNARISYFEQTAPLIYDSKDELFNDLKKDTKRKIKKAIKVGVSVYKHESDSLEEFYDLFEQTGIRDGFKIKNLDTYENYINAFKDKCEVYVSKLNLNAYKEHVLKNQSDRTDIIEKIESYEVEEVVLGVAIVLNTDYQSYYQSGATSNDFRETMHNYLLHYRAMEYAHDNNLLSYNFGGVEGSDDKDSPIYNLNLFKTRFASYRINFIGEFYLLNSSIDKLIYRLKK